MTQLGVGGFFAAAIVVVVLIVVSQSGGGSSGGDASSVSDVELIAKQLEGIPQHGNVLGEPDAKVTVVEFGDPQCPVCKAFSEQVVPELISGPVRDGQARYEFKPWLIIGPDSQPAAEAALAAGEQDRFFNYIELFYRNQGEENSGYVTDAFMTAIAKDAGVADLDAWHAARRDPKWVAEFKAIDSEANRLKLPGTPAIQVVGPGGKEVLPGIPSAAQIEAAIRAAA
jgi:protein-disulfide isomerase